MLRVWLRAPQAGLGEEGSAGLGESRVAQRKRAGPITQRSMDRNHPLLQPLLAGSCAKLLCLCCRSVLSHAMAGAVMAVALPLLCTLPLCFLASQHSKRAPEQRRLLWSSTHTTALGSAQDTLAALLAMLTLARLHTPPTHAQHVQCTVSPHQSQSQRQRAGPAAAAREAAPGGALQKTEKTEVFAVALAQPSVPE